MFDSVEVELSVGYEFAFLLEHFQKKKWALGTRLPNQIASICY